MSINIYNALFDIKAAKEFEISRVNKKIERLRQDIEVLSMVLTMFDPSQKPWSDVAIELKAEDSEFVICAGCGRKVKKENTFLRHGARYCNCRLGIYDG